MNTPYYGDNLNIMRDYIKDESVDLIYLDPPFNSNRNYASYTLALMFAPTLQEETP